MKITEHLVFITDDPEDDERSIWECSCGRGGSCASYKVDIASDDHIDCEAGDTRTDRTGRAPW